MVRFFRSEKRIELFNDFQPHKEILEISSDNTYNCKYILDVLTWGIPIIDFDWYVW